MIGKKKKKSNIVWDLLRALGKKQKIQVNILNNMTTFYWWDTNKDTLIRLMI